MENLVVNSRNIILTMLNKRNFNINSHNKFSEDDIKLLYKTNSLNFSVFHNDDPSLKINIIYLLDKAPKNPNKQKFTDIMQQSFSTIDPTKTELMFILPDKDNDNVLQDIANKNYDITLNAETGIEYAQVFWIKNLCFDITEHVHVPLHKKLSDDETKLFLEQNNINKNKLPIIKRNDPVAKFYGVKKNDVVKITRNSINAPDYINYRLCL